MNFERLIDTYIKEMNHEIAEADYIISKIGKFDQDLVDDIYDSALIKVCIKYEAFTADAYQMLISGDQVSYNHPWSYTRQIAEVLGIDIHKEYEIAHDAWEIYNALKHINFKTKSQALKFTNKYNLRTSRERTIFITDALVNLLYKFK